MCYCQLLLQHLCDCKLSLLVSFVQLEQLNVCKLHNEKCHARNTTVTQLIVKTNPHPAVIWPSLKAHCEADLQSVISRIMAVF